MKQARQIAEKDKPAAGAGGLFADDGGAALQLDRSVMDRNESIGGASGPSASKSERLQGESLRPSVAVRCGTAETAAIIELLNHLNAAREAIEAWDGVTQDHHQRVRQRLARLLGDLFQRHPEEVLAGLRSPNPQTRIWVALSIAEAPSKDAIPALEHALAAEENELDRRALANALQACRAAGIPGHGREAATGNCPTPAAPT